MDQTRSKRCLIIDLTREHYEKIEIKPDITRSYPSGIALATYLLHTILPVGTDPLSPDNVMVLAPGMFAGTPYPGATRMAVATKSPLTGFWAGGTKGGKFAWALSQTGWDAVVIQGKASRLSCLLLDEGRVFFRSAKEMAGHRCSECREKLEETWGEGGAVLCIGPAGESLVKFSTLEDGSLEAPLRGGLGAIFGAKNLKALVVRHDAPQKVKHANQFLDAVFPMIKALKKMESDPYLEMGNLNLLKKLNSVYALPSRNFQAGCFSEEWCNSLERLDTQKRSCPGCPAACLEVLAPKNDSPPTKKIAKITLDPESLWALGPLPNTAEMDETLEALKTCGEYGVDPISFGVLAAWIAECREKKIPLGRVEKLAPEIGIGSWLTGLVRQITEDEDVRGFFGQGVLGSAKRTGSGSQAFAMHVSGQELSFIDPRRGFWPISFIWPDVWMPPERHFLASEPWYEGNWILNLVQVENFWALLESVGICKWVGLAQDNIDDNLPLFFRLISDNDDTVGWIKGIGERCVNLIQAFNWREGWRSENAILPNRFFEEDLVTPQKVYQALDPEARREDMEKYFSLRKWTREGNPGKI
jgi:aldehyde:ferredoxin oxidoreductase